MEIITLEEIVKAFSKSYQMAPPFIALNEEDNGASYNLIGQSDLATKETHVYCNGKTGNLCALNHSICLNESIYFFNLIAMLYDNDLMDYDDKEIIEWLEISFCNIMKIYFNDPEIEYSNQLAYEFIMNNKELINETLYNVTKDNDLQPMRMPNEIDDSLDGEQFNDPYIAMAYQIADNYKIRPKEVIENWTTNELIVLFAKISNQNSLASFVQYKYNQPKAPKQAPPKKQLFFFKEYGVEEKEGGSEHDA